MTDAGILPVLAVITITYAIGTHLFLFDGKKTLGAEATLERQYVTFFLSPLAVPVCLLVWMLLNEAEILEGFIQPPDNEF